MNNTLKNLKQIQEFLWPEIKKNLIYNRLPVEHYKAVNDYSERRGKYFRAALMIYSCEMLGGTREQIIAPAVAMQLSEDWLLIHDDVEDKSEVRRGKPSLNQLYGDEIAINAGDALHVVMWRVLGEYIQKGSRVKSKELSEQQQEAHISDGNTHYQTATLSCHPELAKDLLRKSKELRVTAQVTAEYRGKGLCRFRVLDTPLQVFQKFNDILLTTIEGQYLELALIRDKKIDITREEYFNLIERKTCNYTTIAPAQIGAMVAGQNQKALNEIKSWATPFGYAFQIWDDCMNLVSSTTDQGKERGGDILEGKRTLILIDLLEKCTQDEKEKIVHIYKKQRKDKTETEKQYILNLMEHYGSIEYAQAQAKKYATKSKEEFLKHTQNAVNQDSKQKILDLIEFVVDRKK